MNHLSRILIRTAIAAVFITAAAVVEAIDDPGAAPTCDHELAYQPFAGLILVSVTIGDSPPMDFVLDSGATQSSITDPFLAAALGLELREAGLARGMGSGATRVLIADDICIRGDGHEFLRAPLVVHDIGVRLSAMAGRDIHGFLGADLFERWVVEIDPSTRRLRLHDPNGFAYSGSGDVLPLQVVDRRPVIEAEVVPGVGKKTIPVRLVVDTGSGRYLTLINGSKRRLKPPENRSLGASVGVVGETLVVLAPVSRLTVGTRVTNNLETAWMEPFQIPAVRNIPKLNGILGNALLGRYRTIFDYRGGKVIIEDLYGSSDAMNGKSD